MLMIYTLKNGLKVAYQPIQDSHMAVINMMYLVGSRNEHDQKTGMAHLLEHIAFGGSKNVDNYDTTLQKIGGQNNAYTSSDVTNYWCKLPANQLEIGIYLEADRLLGLTYKEEVINVQRNIVIEEFKQSYLNKPYGDIWHILCEESYKVHPYAWPTIGKQIVHIEKMAREDIMDFGQRFYVPSNAVLVIAGSINVKQTHQMVKKWFESIPYKEAPLYKILQEASCQSTHRHIIRDVPQNALYKTFHIPGRAHKDYSALKLLINYFDEGKSSLFYRELIENQQLATDIEVYTTETIDPGLFVIEAKLQESVRFESFEKALKALIQQTIENGLDNKAFSRAKNQEQASSAFDQLAITHRAEEMAYAITLGDGDFFTKEREVLKKHTSKDIQSVAFCVLNDNNSHTIYYEAKKKG